MSQSKQESFHRCIAILLYVLFCAGASDIAEAVPHAESAQSPSQTASSTGGSLRFIDNPGGGHLVFGPIDNETTVKGGMTTLLRAIHSKFGEKPQIGDLFQVKGSHSVALFFSTHARSQEGDGSMSITGMAIISMAEGSRPIGAVIYDNSERFALSQAAMLRTLDRSWHAAPVVSAPHDGSNIKPNPDAGAGELHSLRQTTAGDKSASIALPPDWRLTQVTGGMLMAEGNNGERITLGAIFQQLRMPLSGDLFREFVDVVNQMRQQRGLPTANYNLIDEQPMVAAGGTSAIQVRFTVDLHDGIGLRKGGARLGRLITRGASSWAMTVDASSVPVAIWDREQPLMTAILQSYSQDSGVIGREYAPVYAGIKAARERADMTARAADERRENSSRAFDQHMQDIDINSKAMQNYILDRTQLSAVGSNGVVYHGTVANSAAQALVQAYPNTFEYVPQGSWVKGIDY